MDIKNLTASEVALINELLLNKAVEMRKQECSYKDIAAIMSKLPSKHLYIKDENELDR